MPRKKTRKIPGQNSQGESDEYVTSTVYDLNDVMSESEMEDKFQELIEELESKKTFELNSLNFRFNTLMLTIPETILKETVDMNDENLRNIFKNAGTEDVDTAENPVVAATASKRRRSRSVREVQLHEYGIRKMDGRISKKRRSSSLDVCRTPPNKGWLQAFTSTKKYTVSKPAKVEDSGISLKRIMKPDEEAISISGSPLLVQPTVVNAPTVNIPLPGGVVMNILPKRTRGHFPVPTFDPTTRQQLQLLCQQLNNLF